MRLWFFIAFLKLGLEMGLFPCILWFIFRLFIDTLSVLPKWTLTAVNFPLERVSRCPRGSGALDQQCSLISETNSLNLFYGSFMTWDYVIKCSEAVICFCDWFPVSAHNRLLNSWGQFWNFCIYSSKFCRLVSGLFWRMFHVLLRRICVLCSSIKCSLCIY